MRRDSWLLEKTDVTREKSRRKSRLDFELDDDTLISESGKVSRLSKILKDKVGLYGDAYTVVCLAWYPTVASKFQKFNKVFPPTTVDGQKKWPYMKFGTSMPLPQKWR